MLETNVHFPTDSNLLYDAIRKTIKLTAKLCKKYQIVGWRQINYNIKKIKSIVRLINKIKKSNPRKQLPKTKENCSLTAHPKPFGSRNGLAGPGKTARNQRKTGNLVWTTALFAASAEPHQSCFQKRRWNSFCPT